MTNKPEHTALPWVSAEKYTDNGEYSHSDISDADGFCIAQVITGDRAKFITRACNSHYELVEALEALHELWGGDKELAKEIYACEQIGAEMPVTIVWKKAQEALAKARGEV